MRITIKAAFTFATALSTTAVLAGVAAGPASAKPYPPPSIHLLCTAAANRGTLHGSLCALPFGVITAPNSYTATTAVSKLGAAGPTVTFALSAGSLPPGLTLPATFTGAGDVVGGTPTDPGTEPGRNFTVQGTGDQGQPLYQAYSINVDQNVPLAINASGGSTLGAGTVGTAYAQNFFVTGGAGPYTWSVASGQLPPGLTLQTSGDPRDANNQLAGTPTTAGTYTFTMRLTDYPGQQATQQFTLVITP